MEKYRILLIEDDQDVREGLTHLLSSKYEVTASNDGLNGIKSSIRNPPDLILLDLRMPKINGFETCKSLREDQDLKDIPILILTAYNTSKARQRAFQSGADDFIAKPFDTKELLIRIDRNLSRHRGRASEKATDDSLICGNLKIDLKNQKAFIGSQSIHLSDLEFRLLSLFISHCDKILSRDQIIENIWQGRSVSTRLIDPHIVALRNKISASDARIISIYKAGYILKSKA